MKQPCRPNRNRAGQVEIVREVPADLVVLAVPVERVVDAAPAVRVAPAVVLAGPVDSALPQNR